MEPASLPGSLRWETRSANHHTLAALPALVLHSGKCEGSLLITIIFAKLFLVNIWTGYWRDVIKPIEDCFLLCLLSGHCCFLNFHIINSLLDSLFGLLLKADGMISVLL